MDVSRINRNKMELRRVRVATADVIARTVETAPPEIDAEGHQLHVSLPPQAVFLDAGVERAPGHAADS